VTNRSFVEQRSVFQTSSIAIMGEGSDSNSGTPAILYHNIECLSWEFSKSVSLSMDTSKTWPTQSRAWSQPGAPPVSDQDRVLSP
jgi:hypothetical protein